MKLGMQVGLRPSHIVLDGNPALLRQRDTAPNFRRMSIVAKRSPISATAEHLLLFIAKYCDQYVCLCVCQSAMISPEPHA